MTDLFQAGEFTSHSGIQLLFKIECDAYSEKELDLFGWLIATRLYAGFEFERVVSVPRGQTTGRDNAGILAQYVRRHIRLINSVFSPTLIVDDVLTTNQSMENERVLQGMTGRPNCLGAVIHARGPCPDWVRPVLTLNELCW